MQELGQLQEHKDAFAAAEVGIVAVSVDPPDGLAKARATAEAGFPFISDSDGKLMDLFGTRHVGGHPTGRGDIARSASVLLDPGGRVIWTRYAENYRVRPTPEEILDAVPG